MKFEITRTSMYRGEQPVPEARKELLPLVDSRCFSEEAFNKTFREKWRDQGANHRVEGDCIARDMDPEPGWVVEIDTLEQLIEFVDRVGHEVVISTGFSRPKGYYEIEIYDDYRE